MRRRHGWTLIEILVVILIITILAAILFPVVAAARRRAHATACQARLHQLGLAIELFNQENGRFPNSLEEAATVAKGPVVSCPHPTSENSEYVYILPQVAGKSEPTAGTTVAYCVEHMKVGSDGNLAVPLDGLTPVLRYPSTTAVVPAQRIERFDKQGNDWVKATETGTIPFYPTVWRFPGDAWPPE